MNSPRLGAAGLAFDAETTDDDDDDDVLLGLGE